MTTKKIYGKRLRARLCPQCGAERDGDGILCRKCVASNRIRSARIPKEKKTKYQRDYRARNRRDGMCPDCGQRRYPGSNYCLRHYLKNRVFRENHRKAELVNA